MDKKRIGIIGTGNISNCHMHGYRAMSDRCEVVAVCDIDENKVKNYAAHYGVEHWYTSAEEMMKNEKLDCVSVCVWNAAHKDCTITALRGGADVICEKPMAMNAKEAKEMLDTAKETGHLLQIGFVRRFGEDADTVKKLTDEGVFGDIYYAKATYLRKSGCPGGWFGDKAYSGGGPLIDLGVHVIDLTRYLAGCPKPVEAFGMTYDNLGPHRADGAEKAWSVEEGGHPYTVEDFTTAMIKFDNGFTISVEASFNLNIRGDVGEVQLFGTKAGTNMNDMNIIAVKDHNFVEFTPEGEKSFRFTPAFDAEIKGFLDAAEGITPCRAPAEDGLALMKIIDAIYESAKVGHSVKID